MIKRIVFVSCLLLSTLNTSASFALTTEPQIAQDKESGYDRSFFKHWIDADKDKCDTRAEVLISEAVVKPKVDKKCKIAGGKWLSAYDGKSVTNASLLDVDHLVPLAEAWRSGAWSWTPKQRQDYANDLGDKRALIAVTLTTNRSKSDRDISDWVPKVDTCGYVANWIAIKIRYSLTYDVKEAKSLTGYFETCKFGEIPVEALSGYSYQSQTVEPAQPSPTPTSSSSPVASPTPTVTPKVTPSPQSSPAAQAPIGYPRPVTTPDNDCPRLVSMKLDKTSLMPLESTKLRIEYKDNLNSILPISLGLNDAIWWGQIGLLSRPDYKLSNFTVTNSQIIDGFVRESISIDFQAPSVAGPWIFGRLWLRDRSGIKWNYDHDGYNDCKTREYVPANYQVDFEVTQVALPTPTLTQTKPAAVKYKNCTEARAAGVTPILKSTNPELYALNTALDGDKDGDACES